MPNDEKDQPKNTIGVFTDTLRLSFPEEWRPMIVEAAKEDSINMTSWCRRAIRDALNAFLEKVGDERRV